MKKKSRLRWEADDDENSRFFHGVVNNNNRKNRINGLNINGSWIKDSSTIVKEVWEFFSKKIDEPINNRPKLINNKFKKISDIDKFALIMLFSENEIKDAIWCCGNEKAPGLYGFTFKFLNYYWDLIKDYVIMFMKDFENSRVSARGCNSSFISLIPKTRDLLSLKDYRPINLVGCLYKVLSKFLPLDLRGFWIKS